MKRVRARIKRINHTQAKDEALGYRVDKESRVVPSKLRVVFLVLTLF